MAQHRLILTSSGLDSPALESEFRRMLGSEPSTRTCWYIPTAPLRDGWPRAQVTNAMQEVGKRFGLTMAWIDPEYTTGDTLRAAIADKLGGRIDVIWAEMGNTYNLCYHIWKSGADKVITDAMDGGAIYVGASAGSIMAGRTCQVRIPCAAQRPPARQVSHSGVPHLLYCSLRRWPCGRIGTTKRVREPSQ